MEEKINVAEILKDCPSKMELDCTICNGVKFIKLNINSNFPIVVRANNGYEFTLTKYGQVHNINDAKCVIFPKGKNTWEGFVPLKPKFKCGDVVACDSLDGNSQLFIFKEYDDNNDTVCYLFLDIDGTLDIDEFAWKTHRLATEEEKQKLFTAIKDNGYKWNPETKTLEKLIIPKFKVGDKVRVKNGVSEHRIIDGVFDTFYSLQIFGKIDFTDQDNWELVPNKFDITTLVPFESRVLVRSSDGDIWRPAIYGVIDSKKHYHYVVGGNYWIQCIPFEPNKELLGTTDDCGEYFKTWE